MNTKPYMAVAELVQAAAHPELDEKTKSAPTLTRSSTAKRNFSTSFRRFYKRKCNTKL